ncbi:MAG: cation diffusion facilitator family transporter [Synergistaceae bacterium]|jgi:cation diffusion facilitator family transporter|nr:cation diffusion facilitator family transporter [Synergistaceae bacterium]
MTSDKERDKTKYIRAAAIVALAGNSALAALKICVGIFSGSGALTADGVDSAADVLISLITLFVVGIISKPADTEHPWGHGRAETVATALLSFVLFFAGAQLILGSVARMFSGVPQTVPSAEALGAAIVSIAGKVLLAYSQYVFGKRADSAMIKANAKNMAGDVFISLGVLTGLAVSSATGSGVADTAIASVIGACVIKTAINVFMEANLELMDGGAGTEQYRLVFDAVRSVEGAGNPHRARMRRIAGFWDIDIDIEVNPRITVDEAHAIACRVEGEIKARLENVYDIVVHVEPSGDSVEGESFGLSEKGMKE